jgi:organic hydroperoxide reductase OsmC/OhrA
VLDFEPSQIVSARTARLNVLACHSNTLSQVAQSNGFDVAGLEKKPAEIQGGKTGYFEWRQQRQKAKESVPGN